MKKIKFLDLLIESKKIKEKYLKNLDFYLKEIKKFFQKKLGKKTKILIFGSFVRGNFGPRSDIDVLVILPKEISWQKRRKLIFEIRKKIGFLSPFEFHLASKKEFEDWWKNFIKKDYKEI